jgi:hypothetical protein
MRDALGREDGKGESVFTPEEVQALRTVTHRRWTGATRDTRPEPLIRGAEKLI